MYLRLKKIWYDTTKCGMSNCAKVFMSVLMAYCLSANPKWCNPILTQRHTCAVHIYLTLVLQTATLRLKFRMKKKHRLVSLTKNSEGSNKQDHPLLRIKVSLVFIAFNVLQLRENGKAQKLESRVTLQYCMLLLPLYPLVFKASVFATLGMGQTCLHL